MANLTATDEDEPLELDEAKATDATPSKDKLMMNILTQMSAKFEHCERIAQAPAPFEFENCGRRSPG